MSNSSFVLLRQRKFLPFFVTQLSGAFNDTLFKSALTLLVTFYAAQYGGLSSAMASNLIAGVFILPFVLLSATAGQLADKFDKALLMRSIKMFEIVILSLAAFGLMQKVAWLLYLCVFLLGVHSAVFGPAKYAYLPQHLSSKEVVGGNGLVEMATFISILLGSLVAGELVHHGEQGVIVVALLCLVVAVVGYAASRFIPSTPALQSLKMNWNPLSETARNLRLAREDMAVFYAMIGISWLWFFGAIFLTHFAPLAKEMLHADERVVTLMLATFSIGIGVGSVLCEKLSRQQLEIGLVPFGAMGMSVFGIDLYFAIDGFVRSGVDSGALMGLGEFLRHGGSTRLLLDLFLLSLFSGLYSVPLYAMIQTFARPTHRARIVAANNIINALFMIVASVMALVLTQLGSNVAQIIGITALLNVLVAVYIFRLVPAFLLRFLAWVLTHLLYRVTFVNRQLIPASGAAIMVANHVSFVDALFLMAASPRPIRFVMDSQIFKIPVLSWLFKKLDAIPIASAKDDAFLLEAAFLQVAHELEDGQLVCIFPEGRLTTDGEMGTFRAGISKILSLHAAPVIPCALQGLWGSFFSRKYGAAMSRPFARGLFSKVQVVVGAPIAPERATPERLEAAVAALRAGIQ
ncbi:Lysophospholipid transporter LplT [Ephemeroptericola cinctiostellae]|uniref:Lysophospholipid transporter LplT n=1 Tax=Ephemeroptericola cinctiostellae TaxID=2268024 RepID=A0A345DB90_9BURK|nr:MFS transporter [Ephemeroptericola cinctiostellae]AXF85628.1 Lysophospholipid transporter LplT [Ephemeroptericola cinctiostellae]